MMRFQLLAFLLYGMISGLAFTFYLKHAVEDAKAEAVAGVYMSLSPEQLTEMRI